MQKICLKGKRRELWDHLLDGKKYTPPIRKYSAEEIYRNHLFYAFMEVHDAIKSLDISERFLRRFPSGKSDISKKEYLQHHIEAYLGNTYVLKERLCALTNILSKKYKIMPRKYGELINKAVMDFYDFNFEKLRNSHVHIEKYQSNDLKRLGTLELYASLDLHPDAADFSKIMKDFGSLVARKTRKSIHSYVVEKNKSMLVFVDDYFKIMSKECLSRKRLKRLPTKI